MRQRLTLIPVLAILTAITACGSARTGETPLARIDGKAFTEGEFALRLSTLDPEQRAAVLADPEQRRSEFNKLLHTRLFALAGQKSRTGRNPDFVRRAGSISERVLTQYYFDTHLLARGGITTDEIRAFYEETPSRFADESGTVPPLDRVMGRVADSILAGRADLETFFRERGEPYKQRATADVAMIRTSTRQEAERAHRALRSGTAFEDVAARYSDHSSRNHGGAIGRITQGVQHFQVGSREVADSLFFDAGTRLETGRYTPIREWEGNFVIFKLLERTDEIHPELSDIRDRVVGDYIRVYKDSLNRNAVDHLKNKYGLRLVSPVRAATEKDLRAHYEANLEYYSSPESFDLYYIESKHRSELETKIEEIESLDAFRALAGEMLTNPLTRERNGHLGVVKRDFSLPFGLGTLPALFPVLDEVESGLVKEPVYSPTNRMWYAFWIVAKEPSAPKPFERVRALVEADFEENRILQVQPRDTLAVIGKLNEVIRERDVIFLRSEIPEMSREMYSRDDLVDYLAVWRIVSTEAKSLGLHREARARALLIQADEGFWSRLYQDSVLVENYEVAPRTLSRTFAANRDIFVHDGRGNDLAAYTRDVAAYLRLTPQDFEIEYHTNPERYMRDTVKMSLEEARRQIFQHLRPVAHARLDAFVLDELKKRFRVRILDASLNRPPLGTAQEAYARAQELHFDRRVDLAMELYERMRRAFPNQPGIQDSISFGMAQLHVEQQRYQQAMSEYRRVLHLRPESPSAYKAMFMIGFIQAEYLRRDEAAIKTFRTMLEKYPDTDLSADADWMIRNIESGGQLMPVLEDDFEDWGDDEE